MLRATAGLAILLEVVQPLVGRSASGLDALNSLAGLFLGMGAGRAEGSFFIRKLCQVLVVAVSLQGGVGVMQDAMAIRQRQRALPVLGDFESGLQLRLWHPQGTDREHRTRLARVPCADLSGAGALEILPGPESFPGVRFKTGRLDASAFAWLSFRIHNPGSPMDLILRADDPGSIPGGLHRFARLLRVPTGTSQFRVPLQDWYDDAGRRRLNTSCILEILWFQAYPEDRHVWCLDDVRLF